MIFTGNRTTRHAAGDGLRVFAVRDWQKECLSEEKEGYRLRVSGKEWAPGWARSLVP